MQRNQPNDYYKNSVKYLQLALNSEPSASAALLPLVQVWIIHLKFYGTTKHHFVFRSCCLLN